MSDIEAMKLVDHLVSGEEFHLVWNDENRCYKTEPLPAHLDKYYESADYISHSDTSDGLMSGIYQRAKRINLRRKLKLVARYCEGPGALMDIGAGTGSFVKYAQDRGWEAYGVEPNELARERAHEKGIAVYRSISVQQEAVYDAITMWHVLEHLPDLEEEITAIAKTLKPEGYLILAVPNFKSLDSKHYKSHWAAYDVPRHVWHFSKASIKTIFERHGFEVKSVKPLWLDAFYISWLSETYKGSKLAPVAGAAMGMISNIYGFFSREFSSHVYILKRRPGAF
ncbi:class I SAM-dependent methyltransferase [Robiginitalea aurantiaca]|uniref:Class I SAM-dependent methyltransferase n=1 Tax=Robiginitalea aurantiaca TaxID=3056915 RepID=A0ABT7WAD2_9FLAO|nr:class I SAM-dependent methyltransferase [Robiginitalea aurantiaca]MDM9629878.1 class I SAM-dependent methyltransferase [Robiginitalea aurantiaca]